MQVRGHLVRQLSRVADLLQFMDYEMVRSVTRSSIYKNIFNVL